MAKHNLAKLQKLFLQNGRGNLLNTLLKMKKRFLLSQLKMNMIPMHISFLHQRRNINKIEEGRIIIEQIGKWNKRLFISWFRKYKGEMKEEMCSDPLSRTYSYYSLDWRCWPSFRLSINFSSCNDDDDENEAWKIRMGRLEEIMPQKRMVLLHWLCYIYGITSEHHIYVIRNIFFAF